MKREGFAPLNLLVEEALQCTSQGLMVLVLMWLVCDFNVRIREVISMFGTFTVIIIALGK